MQRRDKRRLRLRACNAAGPQPSGPGNTPAQNPYPVHMRNTSPRESGTWATFVREAREAALISQIELARRIGVERTTVWRWENKDQLPDTATVAASVARALKLDQDEALRLAGFTVGVPEPEPESDDDRLVRSFGLDPASRIVRKIMGGPWDTAMKRRMLRREREWADKAEAERLEQLDLAEEAYRSSHAG